MKNAVFRIEGLRCDGCSSAVKVLLDKEPGVKAVSVSFTSGEARVLYDPRIVTEERLAATIERPGYRVATRQ